MFEDHQESPVSYSGKKTDDAFSRAAAVPQTSPPKKQAALDSPAMVTLHRKVMGMYERELDRQAENRSQMAVDEDFYDNIQWNEDEAQLLKERGQDALVFNVTSSAINWILGTEKRARSDFKILPRRKEGGPQAVRKTELMKYLADVNRTHFHKSRAFEDCVKAGIGWIEDGVQDDDDGEPVYTRYESWRNILWDSACTEKDLSDARYIFRAKWVDLDIAEAMFPTRKGILKASASESDRYGLDSQGDEAMDAAEEDRETIGSSRGALSEHDRPRVRLIEGWIRLPVKSKRLKGGEFGGEIYDEYSEGHNSSVESGQSVIVEKVLMRMHCCIFATTGMLYHDASPYRHNRFPFTPIWCYRRGRDGLPYGYIRGMRDMQIDINKRAAKALHILSTNKTVMDEGAVPDLDKYLEEVSRPDAVIVKKKGYDLNINVERELAGAHLEMMSRSISMIQQQSGITDENMGRSTNATSGKAILARQDQGSLATSGVFDNLRLADQVSGEKRLSLIEQYFTEEKQFRITNSRGTPSYISVNDGLPENDIVRTKADFIITDTDWRASIRQSQTEELFALVGQLAPVAPQLAMVMIDLLVEEMDIGNREELVKRIRAITGMRDPDAEEPTPEEIQREQAQQAAAELQQRAQMAQIADKEASAQQKAARAAESQANIQKIMGGLASTNVGTQKAALEAAISMLNAPAAASVADVVLEESGFLSRTEQEAMAQEAAMQEQAAAEAAAQEQAMAEQQAMEQSGPEQGQMVPPGTP